MADIEHSQIPSEHCHEPKGAPEAVAGTVYVADGAGSGSFQKLPISSLDTSSQSVSDISISEIEEAVMVKSEIITPIADGTLNELTYAEGVPTETIDTINKNFKELYTFYGSQVMVNQDLKMAVEDIEHKINEIIAALKNWGLAE